VYREEFFAVAEKISIFENMAQKGLPKSTYLGLPKVCWGSNKHTAIYRNQINSLRNGRDSDIEQIENDFKDPEDGFWDKNNSEGMVSNFEVPVNLDIRGECRFVRVQLWLKYFQLLVLPLACRLFRSLICVELSYVA